MIKETLSRYSLTLLFITVPCRFLFAGDSLTEAPDTQTGYETTILPDTNDSYPGCMFKGNYVYAGAINLVWNDVKKNITGEELKFKTENRKILHFIDMMNLYPFTRNDLDSESYYIKSGFGQKTEDIINKEVFAKFPDKTFPRIVFSLSPNDMIAYAYIYKKIKFLDCFHSEKAFDFGKQHVNGFWATNDSQNKVVQIVRYWTDDNFIIKLKLKNPEDELIIAKGFPQRNPLLVLEAIRRDDTVQPCNLEEEDAFGMPELHFLDTHIISDMEGLECENVKLKPDTISVFYEKIKYDLDFNGIKMENEAAMSMAATGEKIPVRTPRNFILNKPFWLIMKRQDSQNPYFILGVNNTEIMAKAE